MKGNKIIVAIVVVAIGVAMAVFGLGSSEKHEAERSLSQLVDEENKPIDFSAFKGKVVFVNNWASWCPPCIAEMPTIQKLKNELKNAKVVFVMVSFDEDREKALGFMKRRGFDFGVYFPGQGYPFMTSSIPATFVLDKEGNLVWQHVGMADYSDERITDKIKELAE